MAETALPRSPGSYVLLFRSAVPLAFRAGSLGRVELPAGWLAYGGSAMGPGGLAARVGRHFRGAGRPRWHVDYLRRCLAPSEAWAGTADTCREADWVAALEQLNGAKRAWPRFGASDSRAPTHLFHFSRRPALSRFRDLLRTRLPGDPAPRRYLAGKALPAGDLQSLKNLGPVSAAWLRAAGIHTREQLERAGPVEAYLKVCGTGRRPGLNLLYALAGALEGCRWDRLPKGLRGSLLVELDAREAEAAEGPWVGH
ncbi:MAG: DUF123 domain-containing protein [Gammaproteobacteria bacterium]